MNQRYELNNLFRGLKSGRLTGGVKIPAIKEEIKLFRQAMEIAEKKMKKHKEKYAKELFDINAKHAPTIIKTRAGYVVRGEKSSNIVDFRYLDCGNDFYVVEWSVSKAKEVINSIGLKTEKIPIKPLMDHIDITGINKAHLMNKVRDETPVIVVEYGESLMPIDGNHRIMSKYLNNIDYVMGYRMKPEEHKKALNDPLSHVLYTMHNNFVAIVNRFVGEMSEEEFNKQYWQYM